MRRLSAIACLALALIGSASAVEAGESGPQSFAFAIGNGNLAGGPQAVADRLGDYGLVVVDGEEANPDEVAAIRARGTLVLGYLSVGTIEKWRSWYPQIKRFRLNADANWKDEWFADVSRTRLRRELARRIAPRMLTKGFDGLFLDNVDMIETPNHRAQRPGMRKLVLALSDLAHSHGRLLFAQNGAWGLRKLDLVDALDGWNREDVTWTYDFDRKRYVRNPASEAEAALDELRRMAASGLITTSTDYTATGDEAARREAVEKACAAGALPYVGDIGLTARRLPDPPLTCP